MNDKQKAQDLPRTEDSRSDSGSPESGTVPTQGRGLRLRCPHCQSYVQTLADSSLNDVNCETCGSHFSLVDDTRETTHSAIVKTIGHFDLIEQIGVGGFGAVWKARDQDLDRSVAVKIPRKGQLDALEAEQFFREARAAAQLKHPNIVSVHEVGRDGDTIYIVSDLVRGVTLSEWLTELRPTPRQALELVAKIADALHHAHQAGVIHRDLKPGNVMVDLGLEPFIMDFGLAKREVGEVTMTMEGRVLGTPAYMSPEQARGEGHHADRRTDIYSLGVILFELLTGELPFRGNARMLIMQILGEEPPSPRGLNNIITRDMETVCLKCLEKDPKRRYQTAAEVGDEIRRIMKREPIKARPVGTVEHAWRWVRKYPYIASLSTAVFILLLTVAAVASVAFFRTRDALQQASAAGDFARAESERAEKSRQEAVRQRDGAKLARQEAVKQRDAAELAQRQEMEQRRQTERMLYSHKVRSLCKAWEQLDLPEDISGLLDDMKPESEQDNDARGYEWFFLNDQINTGFLAVTQHGQGAARAAIWDVDGARYATAGDDGLVRIWDAGRQKVLQTLTGHEGPVRNLAWNFDSSKLASAGEDQSIIIWDVASGEKTFVLQGHEGPVNDISWSPDGDWLASVGDNDVLIRIWNLRSGSQDRTIAGKWTSGDGLAVAWNPTGKWIAAGGSRNSVGIWDAGTGAASSASSLYANRVNDLVWSRDGTKLLYLSDREITAWDFQNNKRLKQAYGGGQGNLSIDWSPEDEFVVSAGENGFARVWDLRADSRSTYVNTDLAPLRKLTHFAHSVDWSPDGTRLLAACKDGTVKMWSITTPKAMAATPRVIQTVTSLDWHPSQDLLASVNGDSTIKLFNTRSGALERVMRRAGAQLVDVAWDAEGNRVAAADRRGAAIVFDPTTGRQLLRLGRPSSLTQAIGSALFGGRISSATETRCLVWIEGGSQLVTGHADSSILVWDAETGKLVKTLMDHTTGVEAVTWSPATRRLISASRNGEIKFWDVSAGECLTTCQDPSNGVRSLRVSRDGLRVATAGMDGVVRVWDANSAAIKLRLSGHPAKSVLWSPDSKRLASIDAGSSVCIWDSFTGQELLLLKTPSIIYSNSTQGGVPMSFSADGRHFASAQNSMIRIWDADVVIETKQADRILPENLVRGGSTWKLLDDGTDLGTAWREPGFDDSAWRSGRSPFGYGRGGYNTYVRFGSNSRQKYITSYFRQHLKVSEPDKIKDLVLGLMRDDGAAVYLNGQEIVRDNLIDGAAYEEPATNTVGDEEERKWFYFLVDPQMLREGDNLLAVEIHQSSQSSSDIFFDLQLSSDALDALIDSVEGKKWQNRYEAADALGQLASQVPRVNSVLIKVLEDEDEKLREHAARALGRGALDEETVIQALTAALDEALAQGHAALALEAALALSKSNLSASALSPKGGAKVDLASRISTAMASQKPGAREAACQILDRLELADADFAAPLITLLDDESPSVRGWAAIVLVKRLPERVVRDNLLAAPRDEAEAKLRDTRAATLNSSSWGVVRSANHTTAEFQAALLQARLACLLVVDNALYQTTLGVARYRMGQFEQALETLAQTQKLNQDNPQPADLAFTAMAHRQLGHAELASEHLAELRKMMEDAQWATNSEAKRFLSSAERLIDAAFSGSILGGDLIAGGASWKFLDDGSDQGVAWRDSQFDDSAWKSGHAQFGYGDDDEATLVSFGGDRNNKHVTTYFRHTFNVKDLGKIKDLLLQLLRDDGVAVYLNGEEIARDNLAPGAKYDDVAAERIDAADEDTVLAYHLDPRHLQEGRNVLAVEIHQAVTNSSDLSFALQLTSNVQPLLVLALKDPALQVEAAKTLAELGSHASPAIPALAAALRAANPVLRQQAAQALGRIGSPERASIAALVKALSDEDESVVREAALALESFGTIDQAHVPVMAEGLRAALDSETGKGVDVIWDLWFRFAVVRLQRDAKQLLADWPDAEDDQAHPHALEMRWSMEQILNQGVLRVNCGGVRYENGDAVWEADRLYRRGRLGSGTRGKEVLNSDDQELYRTERWFLKRPESDGLPGYAFPVPSGAYRVILHFAETRFEEPGSRVFDVVLEGKTVLTDYEPLQAGSQKAEKKTFQVQVEDGVLDVNFIHKVENPKISAIEIRPVLPQ